MWEHGRPASSSDPADLIYSYTIGNATTPTVVTTQALNDESGYKTSTTLYDALLRLRQTQVPTPQGGILVTDHIYQATAYAYGSDELLSAVKDATTGEQWTKSYNLVGEVTGGTTDPNSGASSMTYDADGKLSSSKDANGHTITYTYDALSRKTGEYDGTSTSAPLIASWVYDNSNNAVSSMTDPIGHLTTETST